ncbi:MAG: TRAP transporter small permease [Pseudomonadota bacterium]
MTAERTKPGGRILDALLKVVDGVLYIGAAVGALSALLLAVMLIVEVITTSFFAYSQPYAVEYSGYLLLAVLFAGSGWTLSRGGHIRVDVIASLAGPAVVRLLDLLASAFALGVVGFAATALIRQAIRTAELGSRSYFPSETPLMYPQALLAAGMTLLAVAFAARIVRIVTGRAPQATPTGG